MRKQRANFARPMSTIVGCPKSLCASATSNEPRQARGSMALMKFLRWASSSAVGNVVLFGVPFCLLESAAGLVLNYRDGTLTFGFGLQIVVTSMVFGGIGGLLIWYTVTSPLLKWRKRKP